MRLFLAALLFTGCATEADRYCPVIRATGVAATPTNYVACDPARPGVCGSWDCYAVDARRVAVCSPACARDSDCTRMMNGSRLGYCNEAHCLLGCESTETCPAGTACELVVLALTGPRKICAPITCPG